MYTSALARANVAYITYVVNTAGWVMRNHSNRCRNL